MDCDVVVVAAEWFLLRRQAYIPMKKAPCRGRGSRLGEGYGTAQTCAYSQVENALGI